MPAAARSSSRTRQAIETHRSADSVFTQTACRVLAMISNASLGIIVFAVPFMMAGIRETGVAVFVGCSLLMSVAWAAQQFLKPEGHSPFTFAVVLCGAAIALVSLQVVPLPETILRPLSPFSAEFFPAWDSNNAAINGDGYWNRVSLTPNLTRSGLVLLIAYVSFFLTLHQKLRTLTDIDLLLRLVAIASIVMAAVGLLQLFFGNGDFLWMFHHPLRNTVWPAKGTFTNQNHFAHFLALGIGPLVWWWKKSGTIDGEVVRGRVRNSGFGVSRSTESYQQGIGGALAVVILAGVLSFSRGGIASIAIASVISLAAMGRQWTKVLKLAVPAVTFMVIGVMLFGTEMLEAKWGKITQAESLEDLCRGRYLLWSALLTAIPSFWPLGSGVGSHAEVYPTWMPVDIGKRLSHAESGYMQVLIETGLTGFILLLTALALCVYWAVKSWKLSAGDDRMRITVMSAGLAASALHSVADFVWYIPACLLFALILAVCLCRSYQIYQTRNEQHSKIEMMSWPTCWAFMIVLMALPVGQLSAKVVQQDAEAEGPWLDYRGEAVVASNRSSFESLDGFDDRLDSMISHLEACLKSSPSNAVFMSDLAAAYLRRFERDQQHSNNPISVQEIRNTVQTSAFENPNEVLAWLKRAFGDNVIDLYRAYSLAQYAVKGQPLRGETYLILAQLGFLHQVPSDTVDSLIEQATILRPYSPPVLYIAGLAEAEKGNVPAACEQWKKCFHLTSSIKPLVIRSLSGQMSPEEIVETISPDAEGLWMMFDYYRRSNHGGNQRQIAEFYATRFSDLKTEPKNQQRSFWLHSADIMEFLEVREVATSCIGEAVKLAPTNYGLRRRYGLALLAIQQNSAAFRELEWCRLRNPDDRVITEALQTIRETSSIGGAL